MSEAMSDVFEFVKSFNGTVMITNQFDRSNVFSKLFKLYYSKVKSLAYILLRSEPDAEDVAQEVFARLWERQNIPMPQSGQKPYNRNI